MSRTEVHDLFTVRFEDKLMRAMEGVEDGDPLKDYLDDFEVLDALEGLASLIREYREY